MSEGQDKVTRPRRRVLTFDLETFQASDAARRADMVRLGGWRVFGGEETLSTDGDEIAKAVAEADVVIGHNIFAFDLPVLAMHHGLDLIKLRFEGQAIDTDNLVRLDDPPPSGKEGIAVRPRGYYGLDASCKRYQVPAKTNDAKALATKYGAVAVRIRENKEIRPQDKIGDLAEIERLTPAATLPDGKIDGFGVIPTDDPVFRDYLSGDLIATEALAKRLAPMNPYAKREMIIGLATAQMQANGFRVDVAELGRALDEQADRRRRNLLELSDLTGMPLKGMAPIRSNDGNEAIKQALIREGLKERSLPITENTGKLATGREQLTEFLDKVKTAARGRDISRIERIIELVVAVSGERTVYQTAENTRVGDRVHPTTRPLQASGRWSVTSPGLTVYGKRQGRHVERRIFLPEPGHVLVAFDADQVDARGVAAHSGDEGYLEIFRSGKDLHGEVAVQLFGDRAMREYVKPISHGWNYGESVRKIAASGVPLEMAEAYDRGMRDQYPALVAWQEEVRRQAKFGQLLDNGFGRKMRADPRYAYTQAPALVGQGTTRDIIGEWLVRLPAEYWPYMRVLVHDEIVFSLPEATWEEMARDLLTYFEFDLADVTGGRLASVPITAGYSKPGRNWAGCYEK